MPSSTQNAITAYVLTISEEGDPRRISAAAQLEAAGLRFEFVAGLRKTDPMLNYLYDAKRNAVWSSRSMTDTEKAVHAGHRLIYDRFLKSGDPYALVFEDDFRFLDAGAFSDALSEILDSDLKWDKVKFFDFNPKKIRIQKKPSSLTLVRHKFVAAGAVAYLINRQYAERVLSRRKIYRPIDEDTSWEWEHRCQIWSVVPNLVEEIAPELGGSLIEDDRVRAKSERSSLRRVWAELLSAYKNLRIGLLRSKR